MAVPYYNCAEIDSCKFWDVLTSCKLKKCGTIFKHFKVDLSSAWPLSIDELSSFTQKTSFFVQSLESGQKQRTHINGRPEGDTFREGFKTSYVRPESEDLELTGCPLEYVCDDLSFSVISEHFPDNLNSPRSPLADVVSVSVQDARYLLSLYFSSCYNSAPCRTGPQDPIWIICDGTDSNKTILIGGCKLSDGSTRVNVTCNCLFSLNEIPSFSKVKNKHFFGLAHVPISTQAYAYYSLDFSTECITMSGSSNVIAFECTWSRVKDILEIPSNESAICNLLVRVNPELKTTILHEKYIELMLLEKIMLMSITHENDLVLTEDSIVNSVKSFVAHFNSNKSSVENMENNAFFEHHLNLRQDINFTDGLWNILKEFTSVQTLKETFTYIFESLHKRIVQPDVCNSVTGDLFINIYKHESEIPPFEEMKPLEYLVDMGISKLMKDYLFLYSNVLLITNYHINQIFGDVSSSKNKILILKKLHYVLEVVMLCKEYVKLEKMSLTTYAKKALENYIPQENIKEFTFKFPVPLSVVRKTIDKVTPSVWQMSLLSLHHNCKLNTVIHLSQKLPFDYESSLSVKKKKNNEESTSSVKQKKHFYFTTITCIQDNFIMA